MLQGYNKRKINETSKRDNTDILIYTFFHQNKDTNFGKMGGLFVGYFPFSVWWCNIFCAFMKKV